MGVGSGVYEPKFENLKFKNQVFVFARRRDTLGTGKAMGGH